jgi:hypothetical protein
MPSAYVQASVLGTSTATTLRLPTKIKDYLFVMSSEVETSLDVMPQ